MSSGVILNGGTASNFADFAETPDVCTKNHFIDDQWEPEDLVATVQFLATLDDRQMLPYVLPDERRQSPVVVVVGADSAADQLFGQKADTPPPVHLDSLIVDCGDPVESEQASSTEGTADSHGSAEVKDSSMSSADADVLEPLLNTSAHNGNVLNNESLATVSSDSFVSLASANSAVVRSDAIDDSSSAAQTPCSTEERSIIRASNKPAQFKRVSFGSSKGSMVETLIYESPLSEHEPTPFGWRSNKNHRNAAHHFRTAFTSTPLPEEAQLLLPGDSAATRSASKVRVTFFESERPLTLPSPEASDAEWEDNMAESPPPQSSGAQSNYVRQSSTESGVDNPFRPDGDLSREADELLELLKGSGRPISEVLKSRESAVNVLSHGCDSATATNNVHSSPEHKDSASSPLLGGDAADGGKINGTGNGPSDKADSKSASPTSAAPVAVSTASAAGSVEVQHGIVAPVTAGESQVEHIVIKKKSKCHCCVIQ